LFGVSRKTRSTAFKKPCRSTRQPVFLDGTLDQIVGVIDEKRCVFDIVFFG